VSYFTYGNKRFDDNVVNIRRHDIQARFSSRKKRLTWIETLFLELKFQATGQTLLDQISAARAAFELDYQDAVFYLDGGLRTSESLTNSGSCLSGVKVLRSSFPKGDGDQLAVCRDHTVVLQAEYYDAESELVYWNESIEYIGNGGPVYEVENTFFGPQDALVALASPIQVIQTGKSIGFLENIEAPLPVFPQRVHNQLSRVRYDSGENQGLAPAFYPTTWYYPMTLLSPALVLPQTR
jgi:hypothetical protein